MTNQKGHTLIVGIFIGLLLSAALFTAYRLGAQQHTKQPEIIQIQSTAAPAPSTSPTPTSVSNQKGIVTGKLCFPGEDLPNGKIEAKNISEGKFYDLLYAGLAAEGKSTYSFELAPGDYYLRYIVGGIADYGTYGYNIDSNNKAIIAHVKAGQTLKYDLCKNLFSDQLQPY